MLDGREAYRVEARRACREARDLSDDIYQRVGRSGQGELPELRAAAVGAGEIFADNIVASGLERQAHRRQRTLQRVDIDFLSFHKTVDQQHRGIDAWHYRFERTLRRRHGKQVALCHSRPDSGGIDGDIGYGRVGTERCRAREPCQTVNTDASVDGAGQRIVDSGSSQRHGSGVGLLAQAESHEVEMAYVAVDIPAPGAVAESGVEIGVEVGHFDSAVKASGGAASAEIGQQGYVTVALAVIYDAVDIDVDLHLS